MKTRIETIKNKTLHHLLRRTTDNQVKLQVLIIKQFLKDRGQGRTTLDKIREFIEADSDTMVNKPVKTDEKRLPGGITDHAEAFDTHAGRRREQLPLTWL